MNVLSSDCFFLSFGQEKNYLEDFLQKKNLMEIALC